MTDTTTNVATAAANSAETSSATLIDGNAATTTQYGVNDLWNEGDFASHMVILVLLIMSIASWTKIISKGFRSYKRKDASKAIDGFWHKGSIEEAVRELDVTQAAEPFASLAHSAMNAANHFDEHANNTIGANLERGEFITRAMRQSIVRSTAKLEGGLTMLASIGSVAPFVGLFGTVWGIYHALMSLSTAGVATINKVSGPVGEALIMTAAGLFVAIPAVLAYNAFVRLNRVELTELDGFAHDLHAYLNTGVRLFSGKNSVNTTSPTTKTEVKNNLRVIEKVGN